MLNKLKNNKNPLPRNFVWIIISNQYFKSHMKKTHLLPLLSHIIYFEFFIHFSTKDDENEFKSHVIPIWHILSFQHLHFKRLKWVNELKNKRQGTEIKNLRKLLILHHLKCFIQIQAHCNPSTAQHAWLWFFFCVSSLSHEADVRFVT